MDNSITLKAPLVDILKEGEIWLREKKSFMSTFRSVLLGCLVATAAGQWRVPRLLEDGLLVRGGGTLRAQIAEWKVLVTLDAHVVPRGLFTGMAELRRYIFRLGQHGYINAYKSERASLELGWLTESILPPTELERILEFGQAEGLYAPPIQWYYEYVRILPMWEDPMRLVFSVDLPFISKTEYLRYRLQSWPVMSNTSDLVVHIQVPEVVAFDTRTGGMFRPQNCMGLNPLICRTGPIFREGQMTCPRGIISGQKQQRLQCEVVMQTALVETVEEIETGRFVFTTKGQRFDLNCPGEIEQGHYLTAGVYQIILDTGCRLSGPEWHIEGMLQHYTELSLRTPDVNITPFVLQEYMPPDFEVASLDIKEGSILDELPAMTFLDLADFSHKKLSGLAWGRTSGSHVFLYVLLSLLCTISGVLLFFYWKFGDRCRWLRRRKLMQALSTPAPVIPLQRMEIEMQGTDLLEQ